MGLLRARVISQGPETSHSFIFQRFQQIIASLFVLASAAAVLAQPTGFEAIPPAPSALSVSVEPEPIPEESDPLCPLECFADAFAKHHGSLQVLGGAYFCPVGLGPRTTPRFDFAPIDVRLGCMVYSPRPDDCCLRGNVEAILELTTAPIFVGPGSNIIGPTSL
jgi:hypothetical protein